ncbi:MAG: hypothetical protein U0235_35205 [Polyangiaceae bacterium]
MGARRMQINAAGVYPRPVRVFVAGSTVTIGERARLERLETEGVEVMPTGYDACFFCSGMS